MPAMTRGINVKVPDQLRARIDACATLIGAPVPEFVRTAIRTECERVERLHGQRERAAKAAARTAE